MRRVGLSALAVALAVGSTAAFAQDSGFPFGSEMTLEANPMRGPKRVPVMEIDDRWRGPARSLLQARAGAILRCQRHGDLHRRHGRGRLVPGGSCAGGRCCAGGVAGRDQLAA